MRMKMYIVAEWWEGKILAEFGIGKVYFGSSFWWSTMLCMFVYILNVLLHRVNLTLIDFDIINPFFKQVVQMVHTKICLILLMILSLSTLLTLPMKWHGQHQLREISSTVASMDIFLISVVLRLVGNMCFMESLSLRKMEVYL